MTSTAPPTWRELFAQHRHGKLGLLSQEKAPLTAVKSLADEEVLLLGLASVAARLSARPKATPQVTPKLVVVTPQSKTSTSADFVESVKEARSLYPKAEIEGFGPLETPLAERFAGLDRGVFLAGRLTDRFTPSQDLAEAATATLPLTAVLVYTPEVTAVALEQAAASLSGLDGLVSVVPLPAGAGDRIPLPGLTTSGSTDMMVIAALRLLLAAKIRVRSCWAALGWKVAQSALAYGADEIAGWTAAETLAYTGRVRAASRVERQELDEGLEEARRENLCWSHQGDAR